MSSASFDEQANKAVAAEVHMISGSHDIQTSADVSNVGSFQVRNARKSNRTFLAALPEANVIYPT